jgi:hypothetical protein
MRRPTHALTLRPGIVASPVNIAIGDGADTVGAVVLAPVLAPAAVGILGFSAAGPVAGASAFPFPSSPHVITTHTFHMPIIMLSHHCQAFGPHLSLPP